MILQQLYADSEAILKACTVDGKVPPPMYDSVLVQWEVQLTAEGRFSGCINLGEKGGLRKLVPYNYGRSVDIVPNLLVDTADYALGILDKNASKKHMAFRKLVAECAAATGDIQVQAVEKFLKGGGVPPEHLPRDMEAKHRVMFTVGGRMPSEGEKVRQFWDDLTARECKGKKKAQGNCLITGQHGFVESILPCEIRILRESAPLISVNEAAGCSYGFEQALNGAVSRDAAEGFTKALNALMRRNNTHLNVGDMTYVFWNRQGPDEDIAAVLDQSDPEQVKRLLNTPRDIKSRPASRETRQIPVDFFAAALTGNKTRVVFRDWLALPKWQVEDNLHRWVQAQKIISPVGDAEGCFTVYKLAAALYRDRKFRKADVPALISAALRGSPPPRRLLAQAVGRCRIEHRVRHEQAALLKLALTITNEEEASSMSALDETNTDSAYVAGRLLAVLEDIQYQAQGKLNNTIIDRFFSAATATPGLILPILLRNAEKAHLPKIRRKNGPRGWMIYNGIKNRLGRLHELLPATSYPPALSLEEQSRFLLGYYLQRAARAKKTEASESEPSENQDLEGNNKE